MKHKYQQNTPFIPSKKQFIAVLWLLAVLVDTGTRLHAKTAKTNDANALSLHALRSIALTANPTLQIAYHNVYQAREMIRVARADFLPKISLKDLVEGGAAQFLTVFKLLEVVFNAPSQWFQYKASIHMARAESYALEAVRKNIFHELATLYYAILIDQELSRSLQVEIQILTHQLARKTQAVQYGFGDELAVLIARKRLRQRETEAFVINSLLAKEQMALNIALAREINEPVIRLTAPLNLDIPTLNAEFAQLADIAIARAPEIMQMNHLVYAARAKVSASKWSILSFSGIGLGHFANVRIARHEVDKVKIERERIRNEIAQQVAFAHTDTKNATLKLEKDHAILNAAESLLTATDFLLQLGEIDSIQHDERQLDTEIHRRSITVSKFGLHLKHAWVNRLLGYRPIEPDANWPTAAEFHPIASRKKRFVTLKLDGDASALETLTQVNYSFQPAIKRPVSIKKWRNGFRLRVKTRKAFSVQLKAVKANGEILSFEINVDN